MVGSLCKVIQPFLLRYNIVIDLATPCKLCHYPMDIVYKYNNITNLVLIMPSTIYQCKAIPYLSLSCIGMLHWLGTPRSMHHPYIVNSGLVRPWPCKARTPPRLCSGCVGELGPELRLMASQSRNKVKVALQ